MIPIADQGNPRHAPVASRTIIVLCCLVFVWQRCSGPWGQLAPYALGFTPADFFAGGGDEPLVAWVPFAVTIVTYMFLHGGWLHLFGNVLFLWVFGDDVEDAFGQPGFIVFFLLTGMAAAMAHALADPAATGPVIGASGAVSGVLGAYLVLYPRVNIHVLVPVFVVIDVVTVPAVVVLLAWFGIQLAYALAAPGLGGGIAFRGHVGGFVAGMVLAPAFAFVARGRRRQLSGRRAGLLR